jgi:hypothetical protein
MSEMAGNRPPERVLRDWPMNFRETLDAITAHHRALLQANQALEDAQNDVEHHLLCIQCYERELIRMAADRAVG